ncbi:hypothetical protein ACIHAA_16305 [Streptomyces sp. NPDC052040]|uniref:hypothetical protein n=1 Tax=Streptomyces sp. NPDC052040 TaxID=3365682 RepID=UPI0037D1F019
MLDEALEPAQIRSLNSALRRLSETGGVDKGMQDAAKRLLSGRLALRDSLDDPAVARALSADMGSLRGQWESLSEEEREQVRHGEALTSEESASARPEPRGTAEQQPRKKSQGRHSGGFSLY